MLYENNLHNYFCPYQTRKVKGLGEEDDPALDSAAAWVSKSRNVEKEKELAKKRVCDSIFQFLHFPYAFIFF